MSRVLKNYGNKITQGYHSGHQAVDLIAGNGGTDYVVAHSEGTVTATAAGYGNRQGSTGMASYGNYVDITHANGSMTRYAHLQYISVSKGSKVNRGDTIGYMGNTGNSYGAHLHFEYWNANGSKSDPTPYLDSDLPGISKSGSSSKTGSEKKEGEKETKDITKVVVKSSEGSFGQQNSGNLANQKFLSQGVEILIQNGKSIMMPAIEDSVTLESHRKGSPSVLKFSCVKDAKLEFEEGNAVSLRVNGKNVFYGYVFEKRSESSSPAISVTCYDQLRYFKNKDTYIYTNKKYSELVKMLAKDFNLKTGTIEDTGYRISRAEESDLFDICGNAADETVLNTGQLFVLYDDYGKLCLSNIENMKVPILVDEDTAQTYQYSSSIDKDAYSKIKLARDNDKTGEREIYEYNHAALQSQWGILQYYENVDSEAAVLKAKAKLLSSYYGRKSRSLKINGCLGDIRVRGGSSLVIKLNLEDMKIQNWMVVESVKHTFSNGSHTMDLQLSGIRGEFS